MSHIVAPVPGWDKTKFGERIGADENNARN